MNKHRIFKWLLLFWHIFIAIFAVYLVFLRLNNAGYEGYEAITMDPLWYGLNYYLFIIAVIAFLSGILLIVKKSWGRTISVVLGILMIPFGLYLVITNVVSNDAQNQSFIGRFVDYFKYMGASLSYIDLVCIGYGIFLIGYFARNKVKA